MNESGKELSSSPNGVEQVIDSPKLEATARENRMAKEAILLLNIVQNYSLFSKLLALLQKSDLSQ